MSDEGEETSTYADIFTALSAMVSVTFRWSFACLKPETLTGTHGALVMLTADGSPYSGDTGTFGFPAWFVCFNPGVSAW